MIFYFLIFIICFLLILYFIKSNKIENFSNNKLVNNIQQFNIPHDFPETYNKIKYYKKNELNKGKYCFKKPVFLYDGIWGPIEENNKYSWNLNSKPQNEVYCTDKLLKIPEKQYPINGFINTGIQCKNMKKINTKICCLSKCNKLIIQP